MGQKPTVRVLLSRSSNISDSHRILVEQYVLEEHVSVLGEKISPTTSQDNQIHHVKATQSRLRPFSATLKCMLVNNARSATCVHSLKTPFSESLQKNI